MRKRRIVMAGSPTYRAPIRVGIHHYASLFAKEGWEVCFLSAQLSPLHLLRGRDRLYSREKLRLWRRGGEWSEGVFSYAHMTLLPILPFWAPRWLLRGSFKATFPGITQVLSRAGFDGPDVFWMENPHFCEFASRVEHDLLIARVADDLDGFREHYSSSILRRYENSLGSADLVVTTARRLYEKYRALFGDKVIYVPNGVDFDFFQGGPVEEPPEYRDMPRPIIVYAGTVSRWFDFELLRSCARDLKDMSFVLIGPVLTDMKRAGSAPNIYPLGWKPYERIPSYLRAADVGMIPFRPSPLVQSINPVKLYEYLACGLPVVSTDWEELREMKSPAMLARDAREFCRSIERALEWKDRSELVRFAGRNSWQSRFKAILTAMAEARPSLAEG